MQRKKILVYILIPLMCVVGLMSTIFSLAGKDIKTLAFSNSTQYSLYNNNDGVILSAEKVMRKMSYNAQAGEMQYDLAPTEPIYQTIKVANPKYGAENEPQYLTYEYSNISNPYAEEGLTKDKTVIRNNTSSMLNKNMNDSYRENVMFTFGSYANTDNARLQSIVYLNVTAQLNGRTIFVPASREYATTNGERFRDFTMFFDLENVLEADGQTKVEHQDGLYQFNITYHKKDSTGVLMANTVSFSFYALDKVSYSNQQVINNMTYNAEPTMSNVETLENGSHVFNSYNTPIAVKNGVLQYPILTLDASKYSVVFSKTSNESVENYVLSYNAADNTALLTKSVVNAADVTYPISTMNGNSIVSIVMTDIGVYKFSFRAKSYDGLSSIPAHEIKVEDKALISYGHQLHYNLNNAGDSLLKKLTINTDGKVGLVLVGNIQYRLQTADLKRSGEVLSAIDSEVTDRRYEGQRISEYLANGETYKTVSPSDMTGLFTVTNQAPLWLGNIGTTSHMASARYYYASGDSVKWAQSVYNKDHQYKSMGYYIVVVDSKMTSNNSAENVDKTYTQVFAFQISMNTPQVGLKVTPKLSFNDLTAGDIANAAKLEDGEYTNKNVFVLLPKTGLFENTLSVTYWYSEAYTTSLSQMTVKNVSAPSLFTASGSYIVRVDYGMGDNNGKYIRFFIDKQDIKGLVVLGVDQHKDTLGATSYSYNGNIYTDKAVVDRAFTLRFDKKLLNTATHVEYCLTSFTTDDDQRKTIVSGDDLYVMAGYIAKSPQKMEKLSNNYSTMGSVSRDYVFTLGGMYLFHIYDDAGNDIWYFILLDDTESAFVQQPSWNELNSYNVVSEDVRVTWGTHKALNSASISGSAGIVDITDIFTKAVGSSNYDEFNYAFGTNIDGLKSIVNVYNNNRFVLAIPYASVSVKFEPFEGATQVVSYEGANYIKDRHITANESSQGKYTFNVRTTAAAASNNDYIVSGHSVTLNLDNADLHLVSTIALQEDRLQVSRAYATDVIRAKWNEGVGDFEVSKVEYEFYPLEWNAQSTNYPYSQAAQKVMNISEPAGDNGVVTSEYINVTNYQGKEMTAGGMYVLKRYYVGYESDTDISGSMDKRVISRTFYIDRMGIIEYDYSSQAPIVGAGISVHMGNADVVEFNNFQATGKVESFSISGKNELISRPLLLSTNRLPAKIKVPAYKYHDALITNAQRAGVSAYEMYTTVYYRSASGGQGALNAKVVDTSWDSNNGIWVNKAVDSKGYLTFNNNTFKQAGYYLIEIKDSTITANGQSNVYYFAFEIKNNKPTVSFYGKVKGGSETLLTSSGDAITKDDSLHMVINQPTDKYMSQIDVNNVTIMRSYELAGRTVSEIYYKIVYDGGYADDTQGLVTTEEICSTDVVSGNGALADILSAKVIKYDLLTLLEYKPGHALAGSPITSQPTESNPRGVEYKFTISIQYKGVRADYDVTTGGVSQSYFDNAQSLTIDRTPPTSTVNSLVSANSAHLTKYGYADSLYRLTSRTVYTNEGLSDEESETYYSYITNENYAFAVSDSFTVAKENIDGRYYYRKLNMNGAAAGDKMAGLLPGDPRFSDYNKYPNNYRFNIGSSKYQSTSRSGSFYANLQSGTGSSDINVDGYYEIVEMDNAGNTTNYIVLLGNHSPITINAKIDSGDNVTLPNITASSEINVSTFELNQLNVIDKMSTIILKSNGAVIYNKQCDMNVDFNTVVRELNALFALDRVYELSISNRFGDAFAFKVTLTDNKKVLTPTGVAIMDAVSNKYYLSSANVLPNDSSLKIDTITVTYDKGTANQGLLKYSRVAKEGYVTVPNIFYVLLGDSKWYEIVYTDSLGRSVAQYLWAGQVVNANFMSYEANNPSTNEYVMSDGVYYTTKSAKIVFPRDRYKKEIEVYKNNTKINEGEGYTYVNNVNNANAEVLIHPVALERNSLGKIGGVDSYQVRLKYLYAITSDSPDAPTTSEQIINFVIDNRFTGMDLVNDMGINKNHIVSPNVEVSNTSTSENINLQWNWLNSPAFNLGVYDYKIQLIKNRGAVINITSSVNNVYAIPSTEEGNYVLQMTIGVGDRVFERRIMAFTIAQSEEKMYRIYNNVTNKDVDKSSEYTSLQELSTLTNSNWATVPNYENIKNHAIEIYFTNNSYSSSVITVLGNGDKGIEAKEVKKYVNVSNDSLNMTTVLYRIGNNATSNIEYEKYLVVVHVAFVSANHANNGKLINYNNTNNGATGMSLWNFAEDVTPGETAMQYNANVKAYTAGSADSVVLDVPYVFNAGLAHDVIANKNVLLMDLYYNGAYVRTIKLSMYTINNGKARVDLSTTGIYALAIRDAAGNEQVFTNKNGIQFGNYSLTIMKEVLSTINGGIPIENGLYNGNVELQFQSPTLYDVVDHNTIEYSFSRNGHDVTDTTVRSAYKFTFTDAGTYEVKYRALYKGVPLPEKKVIFTIINSNETRVAMDFTTLYNSYNINKVDKIINVSTGVTRDVTDTFISLVRTNPLISYARLTDDSVKAVLGAASYRVTYTVVGRNNLTDQTITVTFRIDNQAPTILSSIAAGEQTTKSITITYNAYIIHQQVGDCVLKISNMPDIIIDSTTAGQNTGARSVTLENNQRYYVQLVGVGESVISSFRVTKVEPLNDISIILIILGSIIVIGGVTLFIVMRTKMRVR